MLLYANAASEAKSLLHTKLAHLEVANAAALAENPPTPAHLGYASLTCDQMKELLRDSGLETAGLEVRRRLPKPL